MSNKNKSILQKIQLVKSKGAAEQLFMSLLGGDFRSVEYNSPHEYVQTYWNAYQGSTGCKPSLNGKFFELIIETLLYREGILPFYIQAKAAFVPNAFFDVLLYAKSEPVSLSIKTSLRERYKQADLEAVSLKYVHRKAKCYLLTLEKNEANSVANKIENNEVLGLDGMVYCLSNEIDKLIYYLKNRSFTKSNTISVVTEGQLIESII